MTTDRTRSPQTTSNHRSEPQGLVSAPLDLADPTDLVSVRAWLARHTPDLDAVRAWAHRILSDPSAPSAAPALGTPGWTALPDHDPRKLAAAIMPALAHLTERSPAVIADQLRSELDAFATAWRRAHAEASADIAAHLSTRGYSVGPSHAELERLRATYPCPGCTHPLPNQSTHCSACGWTMPTPAEQRVRAAASWDPPDANHSVAQHSDRDVGDQTAA